MTKTAAVFLAGAFVTAAAYSAADAQATRSANEGIYTAEQAERGKPLYAEQCASCHGDNLEGSGPMPALAGPDFQANWSAKTVGELFEKTHTTMPATAPGTLSVDQAADVVAYVLSVNKYAEGTTPLPTTMETLAQIKLDTPGGAAAPGAPEAPAPTGTTGPATPAPGAPPAPGTPPAPSAPTVPVPPAQ